MAKWQFLVNPRSIAAVVHDVLAVVVAWFLAYWFRFNFMIPPSFFNGMWANLFWVLPLQVCLFFFFGLYQGVWRFASTPDLKRILKAVGICALVAAAVYLMLKPSGIIPRSVFLLNPILLLMIMGGSRFAYRAWKEYHLYGKMGTKGKPVIILGAGDAAIALVKDLARSNAWHVVGLLDDDKTMHGRQLLDTRVLGPIGQLDLYSKQYEVDHVIVAMPSADHLARRHAVELANDSALTVLTVPAFDDLMSGKVSVSQIRKVEVEDLLGREPVELDAKGLQELIEARTVLVSGAGGSIGSELCRQILKYQPELLICVDISEFALYRIEQEFSNHHILTIYVTSDIKNEKRIAAILEKYHPEVVFHAAAYKHVPMMENINVAEALSNNVFGSYVLAKACKIAKVSKFVLISTDKAVNPTNVMGASKRLAEMVCQGLQDAGATKFVTVRFGNVLGSSGSVIPKFKAQISSGGPVTITHPEITRYFMSIPEASQLVLQAGLMGRGGEIYVLDMGEPVKINELAKDMIRLSGLHENEIEIVYTGLRPGEKLYEELLADDEHTLPTPHQKLRIAVARETDIAWVEKLISWIASVQMQDEEVIKSELKTWVEEYQVDLSDTQQTNFSPQTTTIH